MPSKSLRERKGWDEAEEQRIGAGTVAGTVGEAAVEARGT
jgi:hypothetical protein